MSPVSYKLSITANIRMHLVIHVLQLKKYVCSSAFSPKVDRPPAEIVEGEVEYEVEKILDSRTRYNQVEYLVKWKSYGDEDNSWLAFWKLKHAPDLVAEFKRNLDKKVGKKKVQS